MKTRQLISMFAPTALLLAGLLLMNPVIAEDCYLDTNNDGNGDDTAGANSDGDDDRLACGRSARAIGNKSVAVGTNADATSPRSTAIGYDADAFGWYSVSLGSTSNAIDANTVAVGDLSNATKNSATAVGAGSNAAGEKGTAIGGSSDVASIGSSALGHGANIFSTDARGAIAIGYLSGVSGTAAGAIAIGSDSNDPDSVGAQASAENAIAIGADAVASVANTVILGSPNANAKVGVNTSTPSNELDIRSASPAIRLDDTSSGAGRVDLDINDNEFAIEGDTNQDIVEIDTRAPEHAFSIRRQGDVGIGTRGALADLHVVGDGVLDADSNAEQVLRLESSVPPEMAWLNSASGQEWAFRMTAGNNFNMNLDEKRKFTFFKTGDMYIVGALTQNSDRDSKTEVSPVDNQKVLAAVVDLPISTWEFKSNEGVRHLGPMAQDFHAVFGLGNTPKGIASIDTSGVALAAIKGLNEVVQAKEKEIESLKERLTMLENLVNTLTAKEVVMNQ
jgi:hypothetical protein